MSDKSVEVSGKIAVPFSDGFTIPALDLPFVQFSHKSREKSSCNTSLKDPPYYYPLFLSTPF